MINKQVIRALIPVGLSVIIMAGCNPVERIKEPRHESHTVHKEAVMTRPERKVAVVTVWASPAHFDKTAAFYKDQLELPVIMEGKDQYILNADGTFVVIMPGEQAPPKNPAKRWPQFALTVASLDESVNKLRSAGVALPYGIETFGGEKPTSRYVMFHDPAGNLIELVEWL